MCSALMYVSVHELIGHSQPILGYATKATTTNYLSDQCLSMEIEFSSNNTKNTIVYSHRCRRCHRRQACDMVDLISASY